MAISLSVDIIAHGLWPQGDIRDPLGVWGGRELVTGDASGDGIKVSFQAPSAIAGAYVYTCYSANLAHLTTDSNALIKCRLLTNWPDMDIGEVGVQGYGSLIVRQSVGSADFSAPFAGVGDPLINAADRFILIFDPRPVAGAFDIVELELSENVLASVYAFEAWGYYWDRSVLNAPGGLRHPGSN